jgi:hypothetical protein
MPDLLTQLSDYGRQLDDETPPLAAFVTPVVAGSPRRVVARPWLVVVGAAVAVLLLVGLPLLINSLWSTAPPAEEPPVTTIVPPTTATTVPDTGFAYSTDSLCDWFTADDMNQIVAAAQQRAGTSWELVNFEPDDCVRLAPPVERRFEYDWDHTTPKGDFGEDEMVASVPGLAVGLVPVAWTGEEPSIEFAGHEMLDESVAYGNLQYDCSWREILTVELRVEGHDEDVLWFSLTRYNPVSACPDDETYKAQVTALGLAVADAMLEQMGWIDQHPGQVE